MILITLVVNKGPKKQTAGFPWWWEPGGPLPVRLSLGGRGRLQIF
jgi:hypothetical protein